jgi:hypothetical protein
MPILTDADMVPFRDLFANLACDKACTVKRPTLVNDGYGSQTETLTTIGTANTLVTKPKPSILQNYAYLVASKATWQVEFPYGQDVKTKDQLTFTGSSKTLIVQEVLEPESFSISTNVLAVEG